jgi:hypothetical protein
MKSEVMGGLKNALERGESLDNAMRSLISAGYGDQEVREAAGDLGRGASSIIYNDESPTLSEPKRRSSLSTFFIVLLIIILLGTSAFLAAIYLFPNALSSLTDFINGLF